MPGFLVLIVLGAVYFLYAILSYFIDEGVGVGSDVQVAGAVGAGLSSPADEVDVGLREQISDLLVEVKGELQVQSGLSTGIELIPGSLVLAEVETTSSASSENLTTARLSASKVYSSSTSTA